MSPVEVGEASLHWQLSNLKFNKECMKTELDLLDELEEKAGIRE